jgi:hypothetical protein
VTIGAVRNNLRAIVNETAPAKLDRAVLGPVKLHLAFSLVLLGSVLLARPHGW